MAWNGYGSRDNRANKGYIEEGNLKLFSFSDTPTRVRFLTEDITPESVMSERKCSREEAEDFIYTKMSADHWIYPKSYWEHSIPSIPNKRFYSSVLCEGKNRCQLCAENDVARNNGVTENKLLPYPVRKRFIVPAYVYDLKMVLFVRGAEDFFDDIANYINKFGAAVDFDIFKTGKGFNTAYKAIYNGISQEVLPDGLEVIPPRMVDLSVPHDEIQRRIDGTSHQASREHDKKEAERNTEQPRYAKPESQAQHQTKTETSSAEGSDFKIPFGQHKGKTFNDLVAAGQGEYIKFLAENSAGEVQKFAKEFLGVQ